MKGEDGDVATNTMPTKWLCLVQAFLLVDPTAKGINQCHEGRTFMHPHGGMFEKKNCIYGNTVFLQIGKLLRTFIGKTFVLMELLFRVTDGFVVLNICINS